MHVIIIFTLLFSIALTTKQLSRDYQAQIKLWKSKVPEKFVRSLKQFSRPQEMCGQVQCQFFYFIYQNKEISKQKDKKLNILILSGMNGKDILGPNILLQAYGKIDACRIIFFPYANPSGYIKNTQITYPGNFSVQNDFPIKQNANCGKTSAYKILHHLYSRYSIDMTIYIHDQMPIISYSWSQMYTNENTKAQDQTIYRDISQIVRYTVDNQIKAGGSVQELNMKSFGNFIDWAYGGFKNKQILSKNCPNQVIKDYSQYKMNGLVFLLGVGGWNISALNQSEIQTQKTINILQKMISVTNPKISFEIKDQRIRLGLLGCKAGTIRSIKMFSQKGEILFQKLGQIQIIGDVTYGPLFYNNISLPKDLIIGKNAVYDLRFQCDKNWIDKGKTIFSKNRQFRQSGVIKMPDNEQRHFNITVIQNITENEFWKSSQTTIISVIVIIIITCIAYKIRQAITGYKMQQLKKFNQKFQQIEYVEDNDIFGKHFEKDQEKEQQKPELIEIKQAQQQESSKLT